MQVTKRDGSTQSFSKHKIASYVRALCRISPVLPDVDVSRVCADVCDGFPSSCSSRSIPSLVAETSAALSPESHEYGMLGGRAEVSNLHRETPSTFSASACKLRSGLRDDYYSFVCDNSSELDSMVDDALDYRFDLFAIRTLLGGYLLRDSSGSICERPQYMYLRVSVALNMPNMRDIRETYASLSHHMYTHATPTLFNAGIRKQQLASCYLVTMADDSIDGIFSTLSQCAKISKGAGGIGLSCSNIRSSGSHIRGTNGTSNGIVPMLQVFNHASRYVNQSGKRPGTFATFLEPWHPDLLSWLHLKRNDGIESQRARDLFYGLYISGIFMDRVREGGLWTFIDPSDAPELIDLYGEAHRSAYLAAEKSCPRSSMPAREIWSIILDSQIETGTPYMVYKDACNEKSNQKNLGTIRGSNLCVEIMEYSSPTETAVCTLASISLPYFVGAKRPPRPCSEGGGGSGGDIGGKEVEEHLPTQLAVRRESASPPGEEKDTKEGGPKNFSRHKSTQEMCSPDNHDDDAPHDQCDPNQDEQGLRGRLAPQFNFQKLEEVVAIAVKNLNKTIDRNEYPVEQAKRSNTRHRPIGLGVQGLADVFNIMGYEWGSQEALELDRKIFEHIYYAAVKQSMTEAKEHGPYETFHDSPAASGILQFDMWDHKPEMIQKWDALKRDVKKYGLRNSLLTACMPTASSASILGNSEAMEPRTANMYVRRVKTGEAIIVNKHLQKALKQQNKWNKDIIQQIIQQRGSIQNIEGIPKHTKDTFKTVWEISMRNVIKHAQTRSPFIDQSQSMNLYIQKPNKQKITAMHFHTYDAKLKTGMYYLRTQTDAKPIQYTCTMCHA